MNPGLFSFFYDIAGLVLIAFTIALARETVIETFEASYRRRREILAAKAKIRKEEKRKHARERKERRERELQEACDTPDPLGRTLTGMSVSASGGGRGGAGAMLAQRKLDYELETSEGITAGKAWLHRILRKWGFMKPYQSKADKEKEKNSLNMQRTTTQQSLIGEDTYRTFRREMQREQAREFQLKLGVAATLFWSFWLVSALLSTKNTLMLNTLTADRICGLPLH